MGNHILWLFILLWMLTHSTCENVWGYPGQGYCIEIEIGSPPQKLNVLLDTGSANLAVAAVSLTGMDVFFHTNLSSSFEPRGESVSVTYTQGTWRGILGSDLVQVPSVHAPKVRCDIALIQESEDFFTNGSKWQGIMGLGYPVLAQPRGKTTSCLAALPSPSAFSLELGCSKGRNLSEVYGVLEVLQPPYPDTPFQATIVREWFYEVLVSGAWINDVPVNISCKEFNSDKSIVDSGTTNLRLPRKVFEETVRMINNSVLVHGINVTDSFWVQQSMACFDMEPETVFPSLAIGLAREDGKYFKVVLSAQSYLHKTDENHSQLNCHQFALEPSDSGTVLGLVFLEGLRVLFDQGNKRVSFCNSSCGPPVLLQGPFVSDSDLSGCGYKDDVVSALTAISVTLGAFLSVAAIFLAYLGYSRICHQHLCPIKSQWPQRSRSRRELLPGSSDLDLTTAT